jgi:hypothetical protein
MRYMMLMIPGGYNSAAPDAMPSAEAVLEMMKYNEALKAAGVLLALDGLHPPSSGARVSSRAASRWSQTDPSRRSTKCWAAIG